MFSIIGESNVRTFTKESNFKQVYHYACLSTDNKPTTGISNGSTCFVMDSGKTYIFDEENGEWVEVEGSGGGGGGGGGTKFVKITLDLTPPEGYSCDFKAIEGGTVGYNVMEEGEPDAVEFYNPSFYFEPEADGSISFPIIEYAKFEKSQIRAFDEAKQQLLHIDPLQEIVLSGGITEDPNDYNVYIVTGDCTFKAGLTSVI